MFFSLLPHPVDYTAILGPVFFDIRSKLIRLVLQSDDTSIVGFKFFLSKNAYL